jgi:hypothetical protein
MTDVKGIRAPTKTATGKYIDRNLFFVADPRQKDKYAEHGWDVASIVADPLFLNPTGGDFRVKAGSPAFKIGFKNFPMDQFGVKKPSLKAISAMPVIPTLNIGSDKSTPSAASSLRETADVFWLGAKLHDLKGEEFSAYGTRKEDGGIALAEVSRASEAARSGLKENDLFQAVNGRQVATSSQLLKVLVEAGQTALNVTLVRNQQVTALVQRVSPVNEPALSR